MENSNDIYRIKNTWLIINQEYNFGAVITDYLDKLAFYISELEKRALANTEIYEQLILQLIDFHEKGLDINPDKFDFSFSLEGGYEIGRMKPAKNPANDRFLGYLLNIVFGVNVPGIFIEFDNVTCMPQETLARLQQAFKTLETKLAIPLRRCGFPEETIIEAFKENREKIEVMQIKNEEEMVPFIADNFSKIKKATKNHTLINAPQTTN